MGRKIDWHGEPGAPAVTSLVPAAGCFVRRGDELLLIERTDSDVWSLPGGKMEYGESLPGCAVRETLEETGVLVEVTGVLGVFTDPGHRIEYTSDGEVRQEFAVIFHGRYVRGEPRGSSESRRAVWVPIEQLPTLRMDHSQRKRVAWGVEQAGAVYFDPA